MPGPTSAASSEPQARQGIDVGRRLGLLGRVDLHDLKPVCQSSTARRITPACPTTSGRHHSWTTVSVHAPTMISGPMPAGSPMVTAIREAFDFGFRIVDFGCET